MIYIQKNELNEITVATDESNKDPKQEYIIINGDYESLHPLMDSNFLYKYKYIDGQVVATSKEEKQKLLDARKLELDNNEIKCKLDAADIKIIRALVEGDVEKIDAHKKSQEELRAKLK